MSPRKAAALLNLEVTEEVVEKTLTEYEQLNKKFDSIMDKIKTRKRKLKKITLPEGK